MKRAFDSEGLCIASFQAHVFESSLTKQSASSKIFIRRYCKSLFAEKIDHGNSCMLSLDVDEAFRELEDQYGPSEYGQIRFGKEELFWIGWMYRYIAYTRGVSTEFVYSYLKPDAFRRVYYAYHTQDEEWVFARLLEAHGLTEADFDINERFKRAIRRAFGAPKTFGAR